jgi:hypothetical protein
MCADGKAAYRPASRRVEAKDCIRMMWCARWSHAQMMLHELEKKEEKE